MKRPTAPERWHAALDLALMAGWIASFIWIWRDAFGTADLIFAAGLVGIATWSHRSRRESLRAVTLPSGTFLAAVGWLSWIVVPALIGIAIVANRSVIEPLPPLPALLAKFAELCVLAVLQQYVLLAHLYRRSEELAGKVPLATGLAAAIFSLCHYPNPFLVPVTFFAGIAACWVYRRAPNVLAIGLMHAVVSFALYYGLPREVTYGLRFGPEF